MCGNKVVPVSAPSAEERFYPYLWRFWRQVPAQGRWAIFDRSWYGRVLVERVRGLAATPDWSRAFDEINDFEDQLTSHGLVVAKFWLDVSLETQLKRFRERDADPLKRFKVDPADWINRRHFAAYRLAAGDMVGRTSTHHAPWTRVDGDDKEAARLTVLRTVIRAIEQVAGQKLLRQAKQKLTSGEAATFTSSLTPIKQPAGGKPVHHPG